MPKFCILFAKSTPAWKKYTNAGRDKYQLCIDVDDDDKDGEGDCEDDEIVLIWSDPTLYCVVRYLSAHIALIFYSYVSTQFVLFKNVVLLDLFQSKHYSYMS